MAGIDEDIIDELGSKIALNRERALLRLEKIINSEGEIILKRLKLLFTGSGTSGFYNHELVIIAACLDAQRLQ